MQERRELANVYDHIYSEANHYHYRPWMYRRFIRAVMKRAGIKNGSSILDAGCGQGFFYLHFCGKWHERSGYGP